MVEELKNAINFENRQEWADWLEIHHNTSKEIWLIHFKKHTEKTCLTYTDALEEAICYGWIDGKMKRIDDEKFILRYSPRISKSIWSKLNKERAEHLIQAGKMKPAGYAAIEEAKRNGTWIRAYRSKDPQEIPYDLKASLSNDQLASQNFANFAPSYKNMYILWINDAKTSNTRKKRIDEVVKRSRNNIKPGII